MIMLKEKIGYGLGDMASSMFWKLFGSYLMIFYTDVFGMPAAAVGTMFLVTRVWDSAFDPVVGILADRTHSRWGKFRPYLLFLAVPFALIGILTFTTPQWSLTAKIIYAYATYSLMMMVYSAINVPYASLLGVISAEPHDRNLLAVYRMLFAYLGSFIALLLFMPMVNAFSRGHSEQYGWMMAVVVIAVACAALFYGCFALTRERVKPIKEVQNPLKEDLRDLFHNRPWWILLGAGIAALVFNSIRDGATVYYFKYFIVEENHETVSLFGLSFVLSGSLSGRRASRQYHRRDACRSREQPHRKEEDLYVGHDMGHAAQHRVLLVHRDDIALIFTFQVLISICAGSIFPLLWSMYADCADYSELKTGNRATGLIFSSSSMSQKFGWAIGSAVTGWLLAYFGFRANAVQNEQAIQGIKMFLSFLPAVGTVLSVTFISLYPLSEKKMKEITEELEERRRN